jgi:histidine triad (HIT) family protein
MPAGYRCKINNIMDDQYYGRYADAQPRYQSVRDCVFCGIVAGTVDASIVARDRHTVAFMDLRQLSDAHVLVVPHKHIESVYALDPETGAHLMRAMIRVANAMQRSLQPEGLNIWQSNGEAAGQEVPHVHFHLVTRTKEDGLLRVYPAPPPYPNRETLDELAARIRQGLERQPRL